MPVEEPVENRLEETVPPHDREAEICALGSMILDRETIGDVSLIAQPKDFYIDSHREIFTRLLALYEKGSAVDLVILKDDLTRTGVLEQVGGAEFLVSLAETVPSAANAEHYAGIVRDKSIQRSLIREATRIIREARSDPEDVDKLLHKAEELIFGISGVDEERTTESIDSLVKETMRRIDSLQDGSPGRITGLSTGYRELDRKLDGLHPGELTIIAARPSMGKTSLALNIADNVGTRGGHGVYVFSCEMLRQQVAQNMLCANARINGHSMKLGDLSDAEWQELPLAADRLSRAPIFIDDTTGISIGGIRAKARRLLARHGDIRLIIVDYLQLLTVDGKTENRQIEITKISQGLKQMSRELHVPVICLSQLNRSLELRKDKIPIMADLRESGSIEQDADVIIFIHREEMYEGSTPENKNKAILKIAKQRNGPTGQLDFLFFNEFMRFEPLHFVESRETVSSEETRL